MLVELYIIFLCVISVGANISASHTKPTKNSSTTDNYAPTNRITKYKGGKWGTEHPSENNSSTDRPSQMYGEESCWDEFNLDSVECGSENEHCCKTLGLVSAGCCPMGRTCCKSHLGDRNLCCSHEDRCCGTVDRAICCRKTDQCSFHMPDERFYCHSPGDGPKKHWVVLLSIPVYWLLIIVSYCFVTRKRSQL